jgi:hypothetical protein
MSTERRLKKERNMNLSKIVEQKNEDDSELQSMSELKKSSIPSGMERRPREENIQSTE